MKRLTFREALEQQWAKGHFVCIGLDTEYERIPSVARKTDVLETLVEFNCRIVDATRDLVCAYKPNIAFYEAYGSTGWLALQRTVAHIKKTAAEVPVILDAKRADIGSSNAGYARAAFEILDVDAITVHPYLGAEALEPFLSKADRGVFVLCRTSNPGAGEFQDLQINGEALYRVVAKRVAQHWDRNRNCGVVVGATFPAELAEVRQIVGDMPILIPGIGAQGGDVEKTVMAGKDRRGHGMIINSARNIIYAGNGGDYAECARAATVKLHNSINQYR